MSNQSIHTQEREPRFIALLPFFVFLIFYLGLSIWAGDFQKIPVSIAFLVASASAILLNRKRSLSDKVDVFTTGMGDMNIMLMCLIFILAGAFAKITQEMGAVNAAVVITSHIMPPSFILAGIFLGACLISVSIGTSCGTIAAMGPIAVGLIEPLHVSPEIIIGAVISGAMFGDNLSMISDTTIAATRTQNVAMKEKFYTNFKMVLPAAIISFAIYLFMGQSDAEITPTEAISWKHIVAVIPYLLTLILALCGINVMILLFFGIILAYAIGLLTGTIGFWYGLSVCGKGAIGMAETLIVAILAGGLLNVIRWNGGISYLLKKITASVKNTRGCEIGIFLLSGLITIFTANNTVAILISSPIAKELGKKFGVTPKRIASLLDISSCVAKGFLPYGAQMLMAVAIAQSAGLEIRILHLIGSLYYLWLAAAVLILAIIFQKRSNENEMIS